MAVNTRAPTAVAGSRGGGAGRRAAPIEEVPASAASPTQDGAGHDDRDAAAMVWDLTVHRLHSAFAQCLAARHDAAHYGPTLSTASMDPTATGLARVQLAATRAAIGDIQVALDRMAAGSYGTCEGCGRPIAAERLREVPAIRWCPYCQADRCG
jgi:RNA polymerase-binding transcription factor DksA